MSRFRESCFVLFAVLLITGCGPVEQKTQDAKQVNLPRGYRNDYSDVQGENNQGGSDIAGSRFGTDARNSRRRKDVGQRETVKSTEPSKDVEFVRAELSDVLRNLIAEYRRTIGLANRWVGALPPEKAAIAPKLIFNLHLDGWLTLFFVTLLWLIVFDMLRVCSRYLAGKPVLPSAESPHSPSRLVEDWVRD